MRGASRVLLLALLAAGCSAPPEDQSSPTPTLTPLPDGDTLPPSILHTPIADGRSLGQPVAVEARISDASGISTAAFFYRAPGSAYWGSAFLERGSDEFWTGEIPASFVQEAGVEYYLKATDASDNRNSSFAPSAGPTAPYTFSVLSPGLAFPVTVGFEPPEPGSSWSLQSTGWRGYVEGFDDGLNWQLVQAPVANGSYAVFHDHGSPFQTSDFDDLLVSPPIDLSQALEVDLYWWEYADFGAYARHSLLISAGSPDPADGDYEVVLEPLQLAVEAEDSFARSRHVDLSAWGGQPQIYLAFRYQGRWGDDWGLDDILLEAPRTDLVFDAPLLDPESTLPGELSQVRLTLRNEGIRQSGPLELHLTTDDPLIGIEPGELELDAIPAGDSLLTEPIQVRVGGEHQNNVFVPLTATVREGERTWSQSLHLMVGRPALAHIEITHTFEDDLEIYLGYGDPAAPDFRTLVQQDEGGNASGTFTWDVDISSEQAFLPPTYGQHRWFLQVSDDSVTNTGTLDAFWIEVGEERYASAGLPQPIPDDQQPLTVFLPGQALPVLREQRQDPVEALPGARLNLSLVLDNRGAPAVGALTGTLVPESSAVLDLSGGPIAFDVMSVEEYLELSATPTPLPTATPPSSVTPSPTPVSAPPPTSSPTPDPAATPAPTSDVGVQEIWVPSASFSFTVDPGHVDSSPLRFRLELRDDSDAWTLPVQVEVPYPVLGGVGVYVDDAAGGGPADGALNPAESTQLRVTVRNAGGRATFGSTTLLARVVSDGGTGAQLLTTTSDLLNEVGSAVLEADQGGRSLPIPLELSGGKDGDVVTLELVIGDGVVSCRDVRALTLGEVPWNPVTVTEDAAGDSQGAPLDLARGSFQLAGTQLVLRWQAHSPFDLSSTYLYGFLSGSMSYQYAIYVSSVVYLYQWVPSGDGSSGYWSRRYTNPASLAGQQLDATTVEARLDLDDVALGNSPLFGGASAGTCGSSGCDVAPEAAGRTGGLTRFFWR